MTLRGNCALFVRHLIVQVEMKMFCVTKTSCFDDMERQPENNRNFYFLILENWRREVECWTLAAGSLPVCCLRLGGIPNHSIDSNRLNDHLRKDRTNNWMRIRRLFWIFLFFD
jgi:hypothetical protein